MRLSPTILKQGTTQAWHWVSTISRRKAKGFTLPELLICLVILGELATFTIPKIITSRQNGQDNAIGKETMAMVTNAYQQVQVQGNVPLSTNMASLTQYMNYVAVDTTSSIDRYPGVAPGTFSCASFPCLKLHNGALLMIDNTTLASGFVDVVLDPDGGVTSQQDSLVIILLPNGRVEDFGAYMGNPVYAPTWLSY